MQMQSDFNRQPLQTYTHILPLHCSDANSLTTIAQQTTFPEDMVKTQVEVKGKAGRGRPPKNLNVSEASTASSSSITKKKAIKKW